MCRAWRFCFKPKWFADDRRETTNQETLAFARGPCVRLVVPPSNICSHRRTFFPYSWCEFYGVFFGHKTSSETSRKLPILPLMKVLNAIECRGMLPALICTKCCKREEKSNKSSFSGVTTFI